MSDDFGPRGDPRYHRTLACLVAALEDLAPPPRERGRVSLLVRRREDKARETPPAVHVTPEEGLPGDAWERRAPSDPATQVAVMQTPVAEIIAAGQPLTLFGDNLFIDLDLSAENLPVGSRLRAGEATLEVTAMPHDGCLKFRERFGGEALRFVAHPERRALNLRGIYMRVRCRGTVAVGDPIVVLGRGPAP
jgi:MOSC domain-containing protein YiiM